MSSIKGQKDMILKDEFPGLKAVGVQYATGKSRQELPIAPGWIKWLCQSGIWHLVVHMSDDESKKYNAAKNSSII